MGVGVAVAELLLKLGRETEPGVPDAVARVGVDVLTGPGCSAVGAAGNQHGERDGGHCGNRDAERDAGELSPTRLARIPTPITGSEMPV